MVQSVRVVLDGLSGADGPVGPVGPVGTVGTVGPARPDAGGRRVGRPSADGAAATLLVVEAGRTRLDSLTGLRAMAALVVFLSHVRWLIPNEELFRIAGREINVRFVMQQGNVGVSFFFMLSGFVLAWSARPGDRPGPFWGRRFARIYPLHLTTWAGFLALSAAGLLYARQPPAGAIVASLFLVQDWIPVERIYYGVNPPAWSLSCELFFYALFPILLPRVQRLRSAHLGRAVGVLAAAAIVVPGVLFALDGTLGGDTAYWLSYVFPPTRLIEFVLGMVLGVAVARGRWLGLAQWWPGLLALLAYLVAGRTPRILLAVAVTVIPFVFVLVAAAGADLSGRRSIWRSRVMVHLGEVSFAFYLVQFLVIDVIRASYPDGAPTVAGGVGLAAVAFVVSLTAAELLRAGVERPAERYLRRRLGGTREPRANERLPAPAGG
jgi:peptidoglycan/LPS O-acetylase OafA/YrhL